MGALSDEARSHVGSMSGTSDPGPHIHIPSAPSKQLPRLLGVQNDTQTANQMVGREVLQLDFDSDVFVLSPSRIRREFESVTSFGGPFTLAIAK